MDGNRFDALSRSVATAGTRRGILHLLSALPLLGVLLTAIDDEQADAKRRRKPQRRRGHERKDVQANHRNRGQKHNNKNKKSKKNDKHKKKHKRPCSPLSDAQTCTGKCAQVANNCGTVVDCGPCDCGACPACQICDATTGRCRANPDFLGQDCGSPGQVCQADGACACDDGSCADGQRCNGIACVCDATSCPSGCCDGSRVCRINEDTACGAGGGVCNRCEDECVDGACTCASGCPPCQSCNPNTGLCRPDAATDGDPCGDGRRCLGGQCICDETSCPTGCCDEEEACHVADADACGADGGACTPCANSGQACQAGACCSKAGRTATVAAPCCAGLTQCADGVCKADCCAGVTCGAGVCQDPGVCDPGTGACSPPTPNTGAACNDGNSCTVNDTCQAGICTPGQVNVGATCGDGGICQANGSCRCSGASCGACRACDEASGLCVAMTCGVSDDCPGSCACSGGICGATPTCRRRGATCTNNFQCCSVGCSFNCFCSQSGEACYDSSDCCGNPSPQNCVGFVCQPI